MTQNANLWAIVLAAGDGTRLRSLTTAADGTAVPKQYCAVASGRSLLADAVARARALVVRERVVVVVAAAHERFWRRELADLPAANVIVQPENRGTAAGILLPLLAVLRRDPLARVAVLPSDHHVEREAVLADAIAHAAQSLDRLPREVVLLGITPEEADPELGWVVPHGGDGTGTAAVARFVEKPDRALAAELLAGGALWNSFVFAARGQALLRLFEDRLPELLAALAPIATSPPALAARYPTLPADDFSRTVLAASPERLRVTTVPACGWSDLGTPERVRRCVDRLGRATPPRSPHRRSGSGVWWDLAASISLAAC